MKDPRGPIRKIDAVDRSNGKALVTLSCGHVRDLNPTFSYRVGDDCRCLPCGDQDTQPLGRVVTCEPGHLCGHCLTQPVRQATAYAIRATLRGTEGM